VSPSQPLHRRLLSSPTALPLGFLVVFLGVIAWTWQYSIRTRQEGIRQETAVTLEQVKLRLEAWVDNRTAILEHFVSPTTGHHQFGQGQFKLMAEELVEIYPGFQALNFVDPDWVIRTVVPFETNQAALNKDLHEHPDPRVGQALQAALDSDAIRRSPLIHLLQGKAGFATYLPVHDEDGRLLGFLNGVFVMDQLVDSCLGEEKLRNRFAVTIETADGELAYSHRPAGMPPESGDIVASVPLRIVDKNWMLSLEPKTAAMGSIPRSEGLFLVSGIGLALALSLLLRAYMLRVSELATSREEYKTLIEVLPDMVIKFDRELRIFFASPSTLRLLQVSEEELIGRSALDYLVPEDHQVANQFTRKLLLGEDPGSSEVRVQTPAGPLWTSWTARAIRDDDGAMQAVVSVGRDISRSRELEQQLRQAQKLQAVGQLAGGIAHDFNNIIQAVLGYIGFAKATLAPASAEYDDLEQAEKAADRAATLTRQLLAFSRRQILRPVLLDINQVTAELLPMLHRLLGESIELAFRPDPGIEPVLADRGQLEQILVNICLNARDAIGDEVGGIRISTSVCRLDDAFCHEHRWAQPGRWVCLELADTGSGMDDGVLAQIFEPFFTTKETGKGTGLGLATVYGIVKQHDGLIDVQSKPGLGTSFSIYLEAKKGDLPDEVDLLTEPSLAGHGHILLVEDQDMVRDMAQRVLERAGYTVVTARDGQQALELWQQKENRFDVIVMDMIMPRMGGRELAGHIRADKPRQPILFISGFDAGSVGGPMELTPHEAILQKPFRKEELLKVLQRLMSV